MYHSFETEHAERFGVEEAIVLNNIIFWVQKNAANARHCYDGRYWTYNSIEAFSKLFPYWTAKQVRRILESLTEQGVILKGNFNPTTYNRTAWYALTDEWAHLAYISEKVQQIAICPNGQMDVPKRANAIAQMGKSNCPNGQITVQMVNPVDKPEAAADGGRFAAASASASRKKGGSSTPLKPPTEFSLVRNYAGVFLREWTALYPQIHGRAYMVTEEEERAVVKLMETGINARALMAIAIRAWAFDGEPAKEDGFHSKFQCKHNSQTLDMFVKKFQKICRELGWSDNKPQLVEDTYQRWLPKLLQKRGAVSAAVVSA